MTMSNIFSKKSCITISLTWKATGCFFLELLGKSSRTHHTLLCREAIFSPFSQFLGSTYWRTIYHNISHAKQLTNHNLWEYLPSLICSHFTILQLACKFLLYSLPFWLVSGFPMADQALHRKCPGRELSEGLLADSTPWILTPQRFRLHGRSGIRAQKLILTFSERIETILTRT